MKKHSKVGLILHSTVNCSGCECIVMCFVFVFAVRNQSLTIRLQFAEEFPLYFVSRLLMCCIMCVYQRCMLSC